VWQKSFKIDKDETEAEHDGAACSSRAG